MNITLVYPCLRNFGGFNTLGKNPDSCFILHGLPSLAACLQQRGHKVKLLDLREQKSWRSTQAWIERDTADVYGIYMSTLDYYEAKKTASIIRKVKPHTKIVVGGPHPSIVPSVVAADTVFDYVFAGEGEVTFPDLVENPNKYPRIVHGEHPDLDKLPYEDREIFNMEKVLAARHPIYPGRFVNVISGRGCPYDCSFCKPGEDLIFGRFRTRSVDHLMGEIEMLNERYNFEFLVIDDDLFTAKTNYVFDWCDRYAKIGKSFSIQTRADWTSKNIEALKRLKDVGCVSVRMGIESFNQRILNLLRKGTTVEQNVVAIENCHKVGLKVIVNYMLGNPTETREEALQTINMVRKLKPLLESPAFYTPIVGTHLYDFCKTNNLLVSEDPAVLGTRSVSNQDRIKGIDYEWLRRELYGPHYKRRQIARNILKKVHMLNTVKRIVSVRKGEVSA